MSLQQTVPNLEGQLILRPPTWDDLEAVMELFNVRDEHLIGKRATTIESIRREWNMPGFDLVNDSRVAVAPDGEIIGHIAFLNTTPPYVDPEFFGYVHPDYVQQGIGTQFIQWAEARANEEIARAPDGTLVTLGTDCFNIEADAKALFEQMGYVHKRSFWRMKIDLTQEPPAPEWPDGLTIRPFVRGQDEKIAYLAYVDTFKDHWGFIERPLEEGMKRFYYWRESDPDWDPSVWFLAFAGDELAGVCLCSTKTDEDPNAAYVSILGVKRAWRKHGLGLALLHHAFGEFYRRGKQAVTLNVDAGSLTGATRLYEKAGMYQYRQWDYYEKILRSGLDLSTQSVEIE